jgi:hypothetical protein
MILEVTHLQDSALLGPTPPKHTSLLDLLDFAHLTLPKHLQLLLMMLLEMLVVELLLLLS